MSDVRTIVAGDHYTQARIDALSATVEKQARQLEYLLHLMRQLGFAQKGWESMEIWENYGK